MKPSQHATVLILDFGSQYTQLITRRVRELGIFSFILPGDVALSRIEGFRPSALILSGGPSSVYDAGAPQLPSGLIDYCQKDNVPILGICYGMQLLAKTLGGKVEQANHREYGRMEISRAGPSILLDEAHTSREVWMSHGDEVKEVPQGFEVTALSRAGSIAAMEDSDRRWYGLQFHPEVTHSVGGIDVLRNFLVEASQIRPDWSMGTLVEEKIEAIREQVGPDAHVLCALSGGVDSCVAAALVHRAIGDRLHCYFVDHGLLRFKEQERVMTLFKEKLHLPVTAIQAQKQFLDRLEGVSDPETKRKIIGAEFIKAFEAEADRLTPRPKFLVQGTLYPDVIESSPNAKHSVTIKTHHNVGGLPEKFGFTLIEPFREFFKDEVRELGRQLGVPQDFLSRHPFPGPGLAVRIIGEITQERINILQQVDEIFIQSLRDAGLYSEIWQAFAVFLPIRSVGVQGDGRTHDHVVALRAVTSTDGMTADWYPFQPEFLAKVSARICNEVRGVNRVTYDISSKPPATIEWE